MAVRGLYGSLALACSFAYIFFDAAGTAAAAKHERSSPRGSFREMFSGRTSENSGGSPSSSSTRSRSRSRSRFGFGREKKPTPFHLANFEGHFTDPDDGQWVETHLFPGQPTCFNFISLPQKIEHRPIRLDKRQNGTKITIDNDKLMVDSRNSSTGSHMIFFYFIDKHGDLIVEYTSHEHGRVQRTFHREGEAMFTEMTTGDTVMADTLAKFDETADRQQQLLYAYEEKRGRHGYTAPRLQGQLQLSGNEAQLRRGCHRRNDSDLVDSVLAAGYAARESRSRSRDGQYGQYEDFAQRPPSSSSSSSGPSSNASHKSRRYRPPPVHMPADGGAANLMSPIAEVASPPLTRPFRRF